MSLVWLWRPRRNADVRFSRSRAIEVESGIEKASKQHGPTLAIIGGIAIEEVESWILSFQGEADAESIPRPKEYLQEKLGKGGEEASTASMVEDVKMADMGRLPTEAKSLQVSLGRARNALFSGSISR